MEDVYKRQELSKPHIQRFCLFNFVENESQAAFNFCVQRLFEKINVKQDGCYR